jgi:glutamate synthase (NADPH/NADH) small chain
MAAAQQLARVGHDVHVYEREPDAGGLMRYGIPDFKMEKFHIQRRVEQMEGRGRDLPLQRAVGDDSAARHRAIRPDGQA